MKISSLAICLAAGLLISAQPAFASQKSDLQKQALKKMNNKDIAALYVGGRTCRGDAFNDKGKKTSSFKNVYKKDGLLIKTVKRVGKSADRRERKWWMDGNKFCETLYKSNKPWCDHTKIFYQAKNTVYSFHKNGNMQFKFKCR